MFLTLAAALILQGFSLFLLRQQLFGTWLRRPFPVMIIVATIYHGLNELVLLVPGASTGNMYRGSLDLSDIYLGTLAVSGGIFIATLLYLVALGHDGRHAQPDTTDLKAAMRPLDWRLLLAVVVPLAVTTFRGQGYASGAIMDSRSMSVLEIAASGLFVIFLVLTTFSFVMKHGRWSFIPAVAIQSLIMAACGQRLEILLTAIVVCMMLSAFGVGPTKRQLVAVTLIGSFLVMSITAIRAASGRDLFSSDSGIARRTVALGTALFDSPSSSSANGKGLLAQATERFDSNEWAGAVMRGLATQAPMGGLSQVLTSLSIAVPTIINPNKNDSSLFARDSEAAQTYYFRIEPADHLPGHFGLWLGLVGLWMYLPLMGLFGLVFAKLEEWTLKKATAARIVLLVLLGVGAMFYERGIPSLLIFLRYGIVLGPLAFWAQKVLTRRTVRTEPTPAPFEASNARTMNHGAPDRWDSRPRVLPHGGARGPVRVGPSDRRMQG